MFVDYFLFWGSFLFGFCLIYFTIGILIINVNTIMTMTVWASIFCYGGSSRSFWIASLSLRFAYWDWRWIESFVSIFWSSIALIYSVSLIYFYRCSIKSTLAFPSKFYFTVVSNTYSSYFLLASSWGSAPEAIIVYYGIAVYLSYYFGLKGLVYMFYVKPYKLISDWDCFCSF